MPSWLNLFYNFLLFNFCTPKRPSRQLAQCLLKFPLWLALYSHKTSIGHSFILTCYMMKKYSLYAYVHFFILYLHYNYFFMHTKISTVPLQTLIYPTPCIYVDLYCPQTPSSRRQCSHSIFEKSLLYCNSN